MTIIELALFWLGFLSGFGFGLTKCRKPLPPTEDVDEETMQRFERIMERSIDMERDNGRTTDVLH
jgi:hypothetical protein